MLLATDIGTPWLVAGVWWRMERSGRQCDWSVPNLQRIMARHFDTGRARWDRADRATRAQVRDPPAAQAARRRAAGTRAATRAMGALRQSPAGSHSSSAVPNAMRYTAKPVKRGCLR